MKGEEVRKRGDSFGALSPSRTISSFYFHSLLVSSTLSFLALFEFPELYKRLVGRREENERAGLDGRRERERGMIFFLEPRGREGREKKKENDKKITLFLFFFP